LIEKMIIK